MVFRTEGGKTYKLRLSLKGRKPRTVSTGATDRNTALDVARMVTRMKGRRQFAPIEAVYDDRLTLAELYDADCAGTVVELMARLNDVDLDPLATEWAERANAKYVRQVRRFIPEGKRFPASQFRRKEVSAFLAGLKCSDPTKNRYRAALSVFAKWLVEREVLSTNPVRDVAMYAEHDPRMVWMTWKDAERVVGTTEPPFRALFALMAGSGMELGAALRVHRGDVDLDHDTVHAGGSKTPWRARVVRVEPWAMKYVRAACDEMIYGPLFPGSEYKNSLLAFKVAQKRVGLSGHRLHDLRHTYAVNALRKGYKPQVVAHQLGHKDATMVTRVYGRFVPDSSDYVTNSVTSVKKGREVKRAK